jgi:hypothetical protein
MIGARAVYCQQKVRLAFDDWLSPGWAMKIIYWACASAFLLAPLLLTFALLSHLHADIRHWSPDWTDEVNYWNETACFVGGGFNGGYTVVDERTASLPWDHFGPHGPGFALCYGLPARIVGWHPWSGPVFNLVAVAVASIYWLMAVRPTGQQLAIAVLLLGSFWPMLLYLPATMQESLHSAIALILSGLICRSLKKTDGLSFWLLLAFVIVASLVRITWVLVLMPWACARCSGLSRRMRRLSLVAIVLAMPTLACAWQLLCSPYSNFLRSTLMLARQEPGLAFSTIVQRWVQGREAFFSPTGDSQLEVLARYEMMAVVIISLLAARFAWRAAVFSALNLLIVANLCLVLYDVGDWRDYRVLTPHLLLSLFTLVGTTSGRWVLPIIAANLLFVTAFVTEFATFYQDRLTADPAAIQLLADELAPFVNYDPHAGPWENTLLIPSELESYTLLGVSRGVGISVIVNEQDEDVPVRSRWMLLQRGENAQRFGHLRLLKQTSQGDLYLNENSNPKS